MGPPPQSLNRVCFPARVPYRTHFDVKVRPDVAHAGRGPPHAGKHRTRTLTATIARKRPHAAPCLARVNTLLLHDFSNRLT